MLSLTQLFDSCCVVDICVASTLQPQLFPGLGGMAPFPPVLTCLAASIRGSPLSLHVISCPVFFLDHCAIVLSVEFPQAVCRGPGRWKLNFSFLKDDDYVTLISEFLVNWCCCQNRFSSLAG